ncbi:MAG: DUF1553 domain-containing protein [Pirellula sp.]|nr:DUF1553 domain-containing protein [Pirellula sp.]
MSSDGFAFFESKIRPLLVEHCFECHSKNTETSGGLTLDSLEGMLRGGDSGPAIQLDQPEASLFLRAIGYRDPKLQMPPDAKLSEVTVDQVRQWISTGAQVPEDFQNEPDDEHVSTSQLAALSVEKAREHWAYRPVTAPPIPRVHPLKDAEDPPESPLDAFLMRLQRTMGTSERLQRVELDVWLRRLSIDLHGLNPTYEETEYWKSLDASSDTAERMMLRERLLDSMLASPRLGERWARRWMDVVRYAESLTLRGFVMPDVWRYRNYLIDAFNSDLPWDRFVAEQIAGDLLPAANFEEAQRQWTATTGLVLGDHNYEEQDKLQLEMDIVDEQLDTLGKAFLAQTIGCARCHDHKFDPIPTSDYYALAGILKSSISVEHENVSKWIRMPLPLPPSVEATFTAVADRKRAIESKLAELKKRFEVSVPGSRIAKTAELPGVIVDDSLARKIGSWQPSTSVAVYVDAGYLHDQNQGRGEKTVTFEPADLAPGSYVVRIAYAPAENRSRKTLVRVASADGETELRIDQRQSPADDGLWHSLGTFRFESGGQAYVIVSNEGSDGHVIADAIQFLPEGSDLQPSVPQGASASKELEAAEIAAAKSEQEQLQKELQSVNQQLASRPMVQTLRATEKPGDIAIHVRGSVHRLGSVVPRGFLRCINAHDSDLDQRIRIAPGANGRLEFAQWMVDRSNPLTSRVAVNRLWASMMGAGIVRSLENFGTTGDYPADPELLDWLATEFQDSGGSTKKMLRALAVSAAYQRSAYAASSILERDPDNRSWARGVVRRLDAESLRDSILQASGELRLLSSLESTVRPNVNEDYRYEHEVGTRTIYLPWFRNALPELIREFDGANPSYPTHERDRSTVATQALTLTNSPWIHARTRFAESRITSSVSSQEAIPVAFRVVLGRDPDAQEREWAEASLRQGASMAALVQYLFSSIDFRYAR